MPRVVADQRNKFYNDELFKKLSRETEVKYTGYRDRPIEERRTRFKSDILKGHAEIAYTCAGINLPLSFVSNSWSDRHLDRVATTEFVDLQRQQGKVRILKNEVYLKSQFIFNGVAIVWKGYVDLVRLDGVGKLEFDHTRALAEDYLLHHSTEQSTFDNTGHQQSGQAQYVDQSLFQPVGQDTINETTESLIHFPPFSPS